MGVTKLQNSYTFKVTTPDKFEIVNSNKMSRTLISAHSGYFRADQILANKKQPNYIFRKNRFELLFENIGTYQEPELASFPYEPLTL